MLIHRSCSSALLTFAAARTSLVANNADQLPKLECKSAQLQNEHVGDTGIGERYLLRYVLLSAQYHPTEENSNEPTEHC